MLRPILAFALTAMLDAPAGAGADPRLKVRPNRAAPAPAWGGYRRAVPGAPAPLATAGVRPAPTPPSGRYYGGPYYGYPGYYADPALYVSPFWFGWSWGWGYYPLWGPRPYDPRYGYVPEPRYEPDRVATQLALRGAGAPGGAAGGLSLSADGRFVGFHAGVDAIAIAPPGGTVQSSAALGFGSAHLTWSVVSEDAGRIRLELGGSMLSIPTGGAYAGAPYAGNVLFGPDVGVSGHLGLAGPLGLEGYARLTPVPIPVTDVHAALAFRGGPLALTAGWRAIRIDGNGTDAPSARFSGPEIGLSLMF